MSAYIWRGWRSWGSALATLPYYKHFWAHTPFLTDPIRYLSVMSLTFEMANLDFAPLYGKSFARCGDTNRLP